MRLFETLKEPFYAWNCVSLILEGRSLDFEIEDPDQLWTFINAMQNLIALQRVQTKKKERMLLPQFKTYDLSKSVYIYDNLVYRVFQVIKNKNEDIV